MQNKYEAVYDPEKQADVLYRLLNWASTFESFCYLNSNEFSDPYSGAETILAVGVEREVFSSADSLEKLDLFQKSATGRIYGFFSYDLKNELEVLRTRLSSPFDFPHLYFFQPRFIVRFGKSSLQLEADLEEKELKTIVNLILEKSVFKSCRSHEVLLNHPELKSRENRSSYLEKVQNLQNHIKRGDIYELNFCQEFYAEEAKLNPVNAYLSLNALSPAPFSVFFKYKGSYILSSSMERFLKRKQDSLLSQPIKGTSARSQNPQEDLNLARALESDPKERAENTMIVDLVRNDLSRVAKTGSVQVLEFCKVYTFAHVHQLISTITAEVKPGQGIEPIIKALFPMGSMTGAPKLSAMELIGEHESVSRSLYSGSAGYIDLDGNFDFNVLIRTILYDEQKSYLSFSTGSAITALSDPEKEYEECILKASALMRALGMPHLVSS